MKLDCVLKSKEDMFDIADKIAECVEPGDVILLDGPLGVGKTYLTKMIVESLGVTDPVTSPTYTVMNSYKSERLEVFHIDAYRLSGNEEFADLAIDEYLDDVLTIVEWGSRIDGYFPKALQINLSFLDTHSNSEGRVLEFSSSDTKWGFIRSRSGGVDEQ